MPEQQYKLRFLPLFEDDLNKIVDYIAIDLHNPLAADNFINIVQQAIRDRTTCAEAFAQYPSLRERQYPYYRIYVRNYIVFYVVIGDVMEVRRILYNRQDIPRSI